MRRLAFPSHAASSASTRVGTVMSAVPPTEKTVRPSTATLK